YVVGGPGRRPAPWKGVPTMVGESVEDDPFIVAESMQSMNTDDGKKNKSRSPCQLRDIISEGYRVATFLVSVTEHEDSIDKPLYEALDQQQQDLGPSVSPKRNISPRNLAMSQQSVLTLRNTPEDISPEELTLERLRSR
ncbi:hypothetical protein OS493_039848, partial [Desmophyllum pertusum]